MLTAMLAAPIHQFLSTYSKIVAGHPLPKSFRRSVPVCFERGKYLIKTIETQSELNEVLRLRYAVFQREFRKKKFPFGFDIDSFDSECDHLVIKDQEDNDRIVGTYRIITAQNAPSFYSEQEFEMSEFLGLPGAKIELGRACIQQSHRTGVVINLLWRGISEYMRKVGAQYLFGCASIKTMEPELTAKIFTKLRQDGMVVDHCHVTPTRPYSFAAFREIMKHMTFTQDELKEADAAIPPLVKSYLKLGVKIYGEPAIDRDFSCIDFLTVLRLDQMTERFEKRYVKC